MIRISILIAALCVGLLATTASTCTQPVIDTGKHCAKVAGSGVVNDILPKVNAVLGCSISDPAAIPACVGSGLADLGVQFGIDFVLCALEQIESRKFVTPGDPDVGVRQRRAKAYLEARKEQTLMIDGPPDPSRSMAAPAITVPIGHGRFNVLPVDEATRMTGAMPIGLTDYNDVQCANFEVNGATGVILSERRWHCESI